MPKLSGDTIGNHAPTTRDQKIATFAMAGAATAPDAPAPEKTHTTPDSLEAITVQEILRETADKEIEEMITAVHNDNYNGLITDTTPVIKRANKSRLKSNPLEGLIKKINPFKKKSTNNGHEVLASVGVEAPDEQTISAPESTPALTPEPGERESTTTVADLQAAGLDPIAVPTPEPEEQPYFRKGHDISKSGIAREVEADVAAFSFNRPDVGVPKAELDAAYEAVAKDEDGNVKDEFTLESILAEFGGKDKDTHEVTPESPKPLENKEPLDKPEPMVPKKTNEKPATKAPEKPVSDEEATLRRQAIKEYNRVNGEIDKLIKQRADLMAQLSDIDQQIIALRRAQNKITVPIFGESFNRGSFDVRLAHDYLHRDKLDDEDELVQA